MKFVKNFNNNAALVEDDQQTEWIVIGKGVGFGKHRGDEIDLAKIERRFKAADQEETVLNTVTQLSPEIVEVVNRVEKLVKDQLSRSFTDYQYLSLADHIDFAIKRTQDGINLDSATVSWETNRLFPKEYAVAKEALMLINGMTGAGLDEGEAVMLTQHFVNLESNGTTIQDTMKISRLIKGIIDIVQYQYQIQLDPDSFNFTRFIGHLRAFMIRQLTNSKVNGQALDQSLMMVIQEKYPDAVACVDRIAIFLKNQMGWDLSPDERVFLILHVWRVTNYQEEQ